MRRSLVTFAGMLLLGLCLALAAPGVELERCDASRQSCPPAARAPAPTPRAPAAACEARPPELDVRSAEAAVRRARAALAARVAEARGDVVPLGGSGYNYQPLPTPPRR